MSDEKTIITRKGTFKCINRLAGLVSALLVVGLFFMAATFVLLLFNFGDEINMIVRRAAAVVFVMEGGFAAIRVFMALGREYSYEAGGSEFVVTDMEGNKEYFYYSDVSSVTYTPSYSGKNIAGYVVEIASGFRKVTYRFRFGPNADNKSTAATPFYCIEVNSGLREHEDVGMSGEQIMAEFERMQRDQKRASNRRKGAARKEKESALWESIQEEQQRMEQENKDN